MLPFAEKIKTLFKIAAVLAALGLLGWVAYSACVGLFKQAQETHPHPTDPVETVTTFFAALQDEDYQSCYGLLSSQRKSATVIRKQSRAEGYFPHFERIRLYLIEHVGEEFFDMLDVSESGRESDFGTVVLTFKFSTSKGLDKKTHYGIKEINEFPIDVAPGIGLEAHNRQLSRIMGSVGSCDEDISDIIQRQPYESANERFERLTNAFLANRQLDTQHELLEWVVREFADNRATAQWLRKIAEDETVPIHLRRQAYLFAGQLQNR